MGALLASGFRSLAVLRWVGLGLIVAAALPGTPEDVAPAVAVLAALAAAIHAVPAR